jgi:UDP-glucose:(glucosyl)LPS alpha-1,2-glucosyltransferase
MTINTSGNERGAFPLSDGYVEALTATARGGTEIMWERISSRLPPELLARVNIIRSRVRFVDPDRPNILWCHDLHSDPEARHLAADASRARFAKLVFVSHWQRDAYSYFLGVPPSSGVVLKNAIVPMAESEIAKDTGGEIRLIYNTTPHRGLEILVPVFERLSPLFGDRLHLDVFSSFSAYGPAWESRNAPYEALFDRCRAHPAITYHGFQPYETVRAALGRSHIQAFPSIFSETSCLTAVDAMTAGCDVVSSDLAAIPETTGGLTLLYPFHENIQRHAEAFENRLVHAIRTWDTPEAWARRAATKAYADRVFDVDTRALQWQKLLYSIVGGNP